MGHILRWIGVRMYTIAKKNNNFPEMGNIDDSRLTRLKMNYNREFRLLSQSALPTALEVRIHDQQLENP